MWWIVVALQLSSSYAQLTSPDGAVCVGSQVVFNCQQPGSTLRWIVDLPGGSDNELINSASSSQVGTVLTFQDDPGFGFEFLILPSSSTSSIMSELRVTAVRQINGVTVDCVGPSGRSMSTIQIAAIIPPAAPSGVMTTTVQSQFTPSTASITLTWSASSGVDNYTIMVTPLLPSGQSLVSTTTTSLQLTVLYNKEYSINITTQNCAGSNSTIVSLTVVGCSPPPPPANGSISEYSSGAVGAMLTFQCDTGYMPQEAVTSTCLSNSSWVPILDCEVVDCNAPFNASGVLIEPFNDTKFGALITFHCEESNNSMTSVCGSDGEWYPIPASDKCLGDVPMIYVTDAPDLLMTDDIDPSTQANDDPVSPPPVGVYVGISVIILFLLLMLLIIVVVIVKKKQGFSQKTQSFNLEPCGNSIENDQEAEYAQTRHPGPRGNNQVTGDEEYSMHDHNVLTGIQKTPSGRGDTLIYADLGPSHGKRRAPVISNIQDDHRVVYSTVNHALQQVKKKSTHHKTGPCPADAALNLDILLIQLKPQVSTKWKQFAEAVGLSNMIIKQLSQYSADECIVEVFDQWLKSHPTKPTWRNVADVLNDIGLHQLADDIMKVYETGELPIVFDMDAVPEKTTSDTETPPPLPPKMDNDDLVPPTRPPKTVSHSNYT